MVVRDAFAYGFIDLRLVETLFVLVPKAESPSKLKDLRQISLCNMVLKLVAKVLMKRIHPFLPELVGPFQSNFIPRRGASENAIVAQEIIHFMNKSKGKNGSLLFKIDLEKAYDKVNWDFLRLSLQDFGFPHMVIELIMCCVTSSSLSFLWNGGK